MPARKGSWKKTRWIELTRWETVPPQFVNLGVLAQKQIAVLLPVGKDPFCPEFAGPGEELLSSIVLRGSMFVFLLELLVKTLRFDRDPLIVNFRR